MASARLANETFLAAFRRSHREEIVGLSQFLDATLRIIALRGQPLDIKGRRLDGADFDLSALAGKVVLVQFWSTRCPPCVAEIPNIRTNYDRYHDRGFDVVGISLDDDTAALERFVADRGIPWPIVVDSQSPGPDGRTLADRYGVLQIPRCILVDRDGTVIETSAQGERLGELLAARLRDRQ